MPDNVLMVAILLIIVAFQLFFFTKSYLGSKGMSNFFKHVDNLRVARRAFVVGSLRFLSHQKISPAHPATMMIFPFPMPTIATWLFLLVTAHRRTFTISLPRPIYTSAAMPARRPIWHCFQDVAIKETDLLANDVRGGLNIPLFFGPAGTFVGIIIGVSGFLRQCQWLVDWQPRHCRSQRASMV